GSGSISQQSGSNTITVNFLLTGSNSDLTLTSTTGNITLNNIKNAGNTTFANTGGNVSLSSFATNTLSIGASSAGAGGTFSVTGGGRAAVNLLGNISPTSEPIPTINLPNTPALIP